MCMTLSGYARHMSMLRCIGHGAKGMELAGRDWVGAELYQWACMLTKQNMEAHLVMRKRWEFSSTLSCIVQQASGTAAFAFLRVDQR